VGEKALELAVELGSEGFVVGHDEGGFLHLFDDFGHGVGLARSGDPHKGLVAMPCVDGPGERLDRFGLIAGGLVGGGDGKIRHEGSFSIRN